MLNDADKDSKGCLFIGVGSFILVSIATAIGIIFKGTGYLRETSDIESDTNNLSYLKTTFFIAIVSIIIFVYVNYLKRKNNPQLSMEYELFCVFLATSHL